MTSYNKNFCPDHERTEKRFTIITLKMLKYRKLPWDVKGTHILKKKGHKNTVFRLKVSLCDLCEKKDVPYFPESFKD